MYNFGHSFLDAFYYAADGNFQARQKSKPLDENDTPLSMGAMYYAHEKDVAELEKNLPPPPVKEVSPAWPGKDS